MTTEIVIENVRQQLGPLTEQAERAVLATLQFVQKNARVDMPIHSREVEFIGRNITLEEYVALPREEKRRYQDETERLNQHWVEIQLEKLGAKWLMVVEGQVVLYGATMDNFPDHDELVALCHRTGKYPFAFFSPRIFEIEELTPHWHPTKEFDDAYPTLSIAFSNTQSNLSTVADLDTGAVDCFASLDLLVQSGVVKIQPEDLEWTSRHLSRSFIYFSRPLWIELVDASGAIRKHRTAILCVQDWNQSPFTVINPDRTVLMGRKILLKLRPRLTLDFAARRTEVRFVEATS